eukprot:c20405_g1_i1 orf=344-4426(+)
MDAQKILDHIIFQLTPTRTRCELFVVVGDTTERLTSGLLKPFLSHLQTAEEQLAKGGCSIRLEPPDCSKPAWFTKGTAERFVRFVSSPDVLERVNTIETELLQLEETIRMQTLTSTRVEDPLSVDSPSISLPGEKTLSSAEKPRLLKKMRQDSIDSNDSGVSKNSKKQLLRALEARRLVLQKEQGMAFARAAAAGYELVYMLQLIMFSDCFGAARLREACFSFVALCRKREITGFCAGDTKMIDQDLTWALSNASCMSILKSMEEVSPIMRKKEEDIDGFMRVVEPGFNDEWRPHTGSKGFDLPSAENGYQQNLPSVHVNLGQASQVCEWSNSRDVYQGWPDMYTSRNSPYAVFQGYQYGFSPYSHESFTTLSDMSPSDATGLYRHPMGVLSQQSSKTQENLQMSSSQESKSLPSLRKLQVGHRGVQNKSRMAARDIKRKQLYVHGSQKDSSDATDSPTERSDLLNTAYVALEDEYVSNVLVGDGSRQGPIDAADSNFGMSWKVTAREVEDMGMERNRRRSDASDFSYSITETERSRIDRHYDADYEIATSNVQVSKKTATSEDSLVPFEQCLEGSLGSKSKKRLDFQEPEAHWKQQQLQLESKSLDDSFYVYSPPVNREQRTKPTIESALQGNQIYDRMSKQALKVNSGVPHQHDPDDLLMMPRQRKRASDRNASDVMDIDIKLLGSAGNANLPKSQKTLMGPEPSQERVKKFLDQYNEKREAKLRGDVNSSKRVERQGKLKAMQEDLEKRKLEMVRAARKPERTTLQTEAQARADKLRLYKADLQKIKKEKEEEERRRLEELKAQRQERIAARSNPSSSAARGHMSSSLHTSKLSPASRLVPPQKSRSSLKSSQVLPSPMQRTVHSRELNPNRTPSRSVRSFSNPTVNHLRSSAPSVPRQTGKASIGSQSSMKTETLRGPQSTKTHSARTNNLFSAVFGGRDNQMVRTSSMRKSEPSITTKKQGVLSGSRSGFSSERSLKGLTSKAGKDMPRSLDERRQEGRTFLKKGSGAGSSGRSVQKPKPTSPGKERAVDKKPLFSTGTQTNGLKSLRLDRKEASQMKVFEGGAGVPTSRSTIMKNNSSSTSKVTSQMKVSEGGSGVSTSSPTVMKSSSSTSPDTDNGVMRVNSTGKAETDEAILFKPERKKTDQARGSDALVRSDSKPSYSILQTKSFSLLEKNYMPSEGAISSLNSNKGPPVDSAMSRLTPFDSSCTMNGDSKSNKQSIIFDTVFPTESSYRESRISSGSAAKQEITSYLHTPDKQQSNESGRFPRFGQKSMHSPASTTSEGHGEAECHSGNTISNHRRLSLNRFTHPSQSAKKQSKATVSCRGSEPSSTAKALRPFSFLGTFRSKAAEAKWR